MKIKGTALLLWSLLLAGVGCSHESQVITGTVVDEAGGAVNAAEVKACYSGWGWSAGQLVWDKDYCSPPVKSDASGAYTISFAGPVSMRLRASKPGWIQRRDFNATAPRIVLVRSEDNSARQAAEQARREELFHQRLTDESPEGYYYRVILPRVRAVDLNHRGARLAITPVLLAAEDRNGALLAVRGEVAAVTAFAGGLRLVSAGTPLDDSRFALTAPVADCAAGVHFIEIAGPELPAGPDQRLELFVPEAGAIFDLQLRRLSALP